MPTTAQGHVAVLAFPFGTHAAPLLAVISRLASSTPNAIYSIFITASSNASTFKSHTYSNIKAYDVGDGVPEGYVFTGKPQEHIELFLNAARRNFAKGMEAAVAETGRKVTCLVTDAFLWFGADMAKEIQVPWLAFWTAGPVSLSAHIYTDIIRESLGQGGISGREDEALEFIPGMSRVRARDLPEGIVFGNLNSVFSSMLHQMGRALPEAAAVFINSFEELDLTVTNDLKSKSNRFLSIGPFNLITKPSPSSIITPDDSRCLVWLDKQKIASVAYISFGSVTVPPQKELVALAEALEASESPFIWSLKEQAHSQLPLGFFDRTKERGLVVPWAPQSAILSHRGVGVFITHCGWNSLLESIAGGVPMICRPFFGDQRLNGRMISDVWNVGVTVKEGIFTKDDVERVLKGLVQSPEIWTKMRENMVLLRRLAQAAVGPSGSSTQNFRVLQDMLPSSTC